MYSLSFIFVRRGRTRRAYTHNHAVIAAVVLFNAYIHIAVFPQDIRYAGRLPVPDFKTDAAARPELRRRILRCSTAVLGKKKAFALIFVPIMVF